MQDGRLCRPRDDHHGRCLVRLDQLDRDRVVSDGVTWPSASVVVLDTGDLDSFRWLVDLLGPSGAPNTWRAAYLGAAS